MGLKLVYRVLRKISDWALSEFYAEVCVEGGENVPASGPLIVVASHHNEIIDIATLAATIPHRRPLCFWAKSTMFRSPLSRAVLTSSGSIPVYRNPNSFTVSNINASLPTTNPSAPSNGTAQPKQTTTSTGTDSLFASTCEALARGEVVGVFPEGTSYTEPRIAQVKEGAARAAVEYIKWVSGPGRTERKAEADGVTVVPVGIVYTDKSQFQSRVYVRYGEPIPMDAYVPRIQTGEEEEMKSAVRELTAEIERRMVELTVNSPDWDTLYTANMARDLAYSASGTENIPLKDYVRVSQRFIDLISSRSFADVNQGLIKYYSLLHYTGISHAILSSILPPPLVLTTDSGERAPLLPDNTKQVSEVTSSRALWIFIKNVLGMFAHPRLWLFVPPFVVHIPAYLLGLLAARFLATPGEEEGIAQFKVIFGGVGRGVGLGLAGAGAVRLMKLASCAGPSAPSPGMERLGSVIARLGRLDVAATPETLGKIATVLRQAEQWVFCGSGWTGKTKEVLGVVGIFYVVGWVLVRWHNLLVKANYQQFKRLLASYTLFLSAVSPRSTDVPLDKLAPYCMPPIPVINPYIKRQLPLPKEREKITPVAAYRLARWLLEARVEAVEVVQRWVGVNGAGVAI